jgi:hypothetical protein
MTMHTGLAAAALAVLALAAGCGEKDEPEGGDPPERVSYPTGAGEVVLQVFTGGGYVPQIDMLRDYPEVVLYGDGRLVTPTPRAVDAELPPREELQVRELSPDQTQAIVDAAAAAGLTEPLEDYGFPEITDLGTTTFTLNANGARHEASAYALGHPADGPAEVTEGRAALEAFAEDLDDPEALLGEGAPPPEPFEPEAWLVSPAAAPEKCRVVEDLAEVRGDMGKLAIRPAIGFEDTCRGAFGT